MHFNVHFNLYYYFLLLLVHVEVQEVQEVPLKAQLEVEDVHDRAAFVKHVLMFCVRLA